MIRTPCSVKSMVMPTSLFKLKVNLDRRNILTTDTTPDICLVRWSVAGFDSQRTPVALLVKVFVKLRYTQLMFLFFTRSTV